MKTKSLFVAAIVVVISLVCGDRASSKPAGCPCSPCTCSPCPCGSGSSSGGGGKSKKSSKKHHKKGKHHDDGGSSSSVGVGVGVDLSGVGKQQREADPFAVPVESSSTTTAKTQEKPKSKKKESSVTTSNPFGYVELTGPKVKDTEKPSEDVDATEQAADTSGVEIADRTGDSTGGTRGKPKKEKGPGKPLKKWPQPVQDWYDKWHAWYAAQGPLLDAKDKYALALHPTLKKSAQYWKLVNKSYEATQKAQAAGATAEDKANAEKAQKELHEHMEKLKKDFNQTPEGQKASKELADAEKAAQKAHDAEKEAGKNIDQATKDAAINSPPEP